MNTEGSGSTEVKSASAWEDKGKLKRDGVHTIPGF